MTQRAALIKDGTVINVVLADEGWEPGDGTEVRFLKDGEQVSPGDLVIGDGYERPDVPDPKPSSEERIAALEDELRGIKQRAAAASVSNTDAAKVRDAITG